MRFRLRVPLPGKPSEYARILPALAKRAWPWALALALHGALLVALRFGPPPHAPESPPSENVIEVVLAEAPPSRAEPPALPEEAELPEEAGLPEPPAPEAANSEPPNAKAEETASAPTLAPEPPVGAAPVEAPPVAAPIFTPEPAPALESAPADAQILALPREARRGLRRALCGARSGREARPGDGDILDCPRIAESADGRIVPNASPKRGRHAYEGGDYTHLFGARARGMRWEEALAAAGLTDPRDLLFDPRRTIMQQMGRPNFADEALGPIRSQEPSWTTIDPAFYGSGDDPGP